jgi:hypothetical protein
MFLFFTIGSAISSSADSFLFKSAFVSAFLFTSGSVTIGGCCLRLFFFETIDSEVSFAC